MNKNFPPVHAYFSTNETDRNIDVIKRQGCLQMDWLRFDLYEGWNHRKECTGSILYLVSPLNSESVAGV